MPIQASWAARLAPAWPPSFVKEPARMRRLVVTSIALSLAALVAGCGKSSTQDQGGGQASSEAAGPALTPDQEKKIQATLPAPYSTADLANGEAKFAMCASCHTITPGGPNMTGPHLHGVVGRKAGSV